MLQETVIIISKNHILFQNYSGDSVTHSRLEKYLAGGEMMKKESLHYSSLPCERLESDEFHDQTYRVASTEAVVNLSSSITLIYLYCSRLPSDGLVRLLLPLFHILFLCLMNLEICFLIWFFKLSGTLNQLRGGTKKQEYCIFLRVVLYRLLMYKVTQSS
jgi:hypothetical protein